MTKTIPKGQYARPGLDLPSWFLSSLKSIDQHLQVILHPYRIQYDDVMNLDYGELEDPRLQIVEEGGTAIMGWVLRDLDGSPIPDGRFHVWRYCDGFPGWCHVVDIDSKEPKHLRRILTRLDLQARLGLKSVRAYREFLTQEDEELREKKRERVDQALSDISKDNKSMLRTAMENMEHGRINPTNPQKETITSYSGQTNRSRISRPLSDEDVKIPSLDEALK